MIELTTEPAELRFTIQITRKETGEVETYDMVGHVINDNVERREEIENGSNTLDSGT